MDLLLLFVHHYYDIIIWIYYYDIIIWIYYYDIIIIIYYYDIILDLLLLFIIWIYYYGFINWKNKLEVRKKSREYEKQREKD